MRRILIAFVAVIAIAGSVAGCAGVPDSTKPTVALHGPSVQKIESPYKEAMACTAKIPEVSTIKVGVDQINDLTGKTNIQTDGTGSFVTQGATDMMTTSLAKIGVQVVELSQAYKSNVDWYAGKEKEDAAFFSLKKPQFLVLGSVSALDFGTYGTVAEVTAYGVGPKARAFRATGRMDVRIVTMPYDNTEEKGSGTTGGSVQAVSAFKKEFVAEEIGFGMARFVGGGDGLTFASFNLGASQREPMQLTIGYMADYGAVDLVLGLLEKLGYRSHEVTACRKLLVDPKSTGEKVQVASAG